MSKFGKLLGLILFMGTIFSSCLLLVSKSKEEVIFEEYLQDVVERTFPFKRDSDSVSSYNLTMQKLYDAALQSYYIEMQKHYEMIRSNSK